MFPPKGTLDQMREVAAAYRQRAPKPRKKVWIAPEPEDFAYGGVLAFDQTLGKTGVAQIWSTPDDGLYIRYADVLVPSTTEHRGFEETFHRAEEMGSMLSLAIIMWSDADIDIVHEMPAVQGHRIESSLMAAREVRRANADCYARPLHMISRTAAYATLVGSGFAEKREMTTAVNRLIPPSRRTTRRWTQDVHDAVGLGLKHLYDRKQASS